MSTQDDLVINEEGGKKEDNLLPIKVDIEDNNKCHKCSNFLYKGKYLIIALLIIIIGVSSYFIITKLIIKKNDKNETKKEKSESKEESMKPDYEGEKIYYENTDKITEYILKSGGGIKIGIFSDSQLSQIPNRGYYDYDKYRRNVENTLNYFKNEKVDVIIIAGDITDNGFEEEYKLYINIFNKVFSDEETKPKTFEIMGNHEYYGMKYGVSGYNIEKHINLFKQYFKKYPFYHVIINHFHFIFWSHQNYITKEKDNKIFYTNWLKEELIKANNSLYHPNDPIFVVTHAPPKETVYGSGVSEKRCSGFQATYDLLKNYSNVICLSGHSHRSLKNERSIWQKEFTAINTQSVSYLALNYSYYKSGEIVKNSVDSYMGLVADLNRNEINFKRIYFHTGDILENQWIIKFPINKEEFKYTYEINKLIYGIPEIVNHKIEINKTENSFNLSFYPANHKLFIHSYRFEYYNKQKKKNVINLYGKYYLNEQINNSLPLIYNFDNMNIDIDSGYSLYAIDFYFNEQKY